jgi:hypothetical protein
VTDLGGGLRQVSGCGRATTEEIDGERLCRLHADEHRYQRRQFEDMMARATRHAGQIAIHGEGRHCLCGAFVPDGDEHPWGVPEREEVAWWDGHPDAPRAEQ